MEIINNNIYVSLSVTNAAKLEETIKTGIEKELIFTVELLQSWRFWPDEFVVSKQIRKIIKYDNLRERYRVTINDGVNSREMYFKDYYSIQDWIFVVNNINLANVKELSPGDYYIRMVVESKSIEHLPFLGLLMMFIPEIEMSMARESALFRIGSTR